MEIKTIIFEEGHFDRKKYSHTENFMSTFLGREEKLSNPQSAFSILAQFTNRDYDAIEFRDIDNISDDTYLEMSTFQFYALADREWIRDRNIIVTNLFEPWVIGLPYDDQHEISGTTFDDPTIFDNVGIAKSFSFVIDNADPRLRQMYPQVNWVYPNVWHLECVESMTWPKHPLRESFIENIDMHAYIDKHVHKNKEHDFTCLIGKVKPHRMDLWFQLIQNNLVGDNIVGSWDKHIINPKYEDEPRASMDRVIKPTWIEGAKVWVALESFPEQLNSKFHITQITEKTFKPIRYGMPFLVHGTKHTFDIIESMGYNTYREIFGNYITDDPHTTNKNIVAILKCLNTYDWDRIKEIAHHNFTVLENQNRAELFAQLRSDITKHN